MEGAKGSERVERERESGRERKDRETCSLSKEREREERETCCIRREFSTRGKKKRKKDGGKRNKLILGHTLL